jgi:hypothetical protein
MSGSQDKLCYITPHGTASCAKYIFAPCVSIYVQYCTTCATDLCRLATEDSEVLRLLTLVERELFDE